VLSNLTELRKANVFVKGSSVANEVGRKRPVHAKQRIRMSYSEFDNYDEARSEIIAEGIREIRDDRIAAYLGTYGDAVQKRIDKCLSGGEQLLTSGFPSQAVISSVTAAELILRYFILRPIVEGAFMSDDWAHILVHRILTRRAVNDREILPAVLRVWNIDLESVRMPSGNRLWEKFIREIVPLRNGIVHNGARATDEQGRDALACPTILIENVICPLSDRLGFSWSKTRCWSEIQQGVGGAWQTTRYDPLSPFDRND
jgi:hypothetical protein